MIKYANMQNFNDLKEYDRHISESELKSLIAAKRVIIMQNDGMFIGWLRFGLFWDNIPFMNMLYILDGFRGKGFGRELVEFWERKMSMAGYNRVLTSTQSDEQAQFFYRKLGYTDCGALILPPDPLEIFLVKNLE